MKILMATMGLDIGGAETHIVELAKELHSRGHEVLVASNGGVYVPEIEQAGIRHYNVPMHRRSAGCMLRSRALLKQIIQSQRPDVVHAHARIPAFLCGSLQRSLHFPFVTTVHGVYKVSGMLRWMTNWGERALAVSEDIRDYLLREYQLPAGHVSLTINGVDTGKFSAEISGAGVRRELGLADRPVVVHVSRLDAEVALVARQLIALAPDLDRAVPGVQVLIVGGGDVYQELREQAGAVNRALGRDCVVMTGPRTDVNELLSCATLFVGVSRAALEAMSTEKPVILGGAQGYGGLFTPASLPMAVDSNFCCRGCPMPTTEGLREDICAALALPEEERKRLGRFGREIIFQSYSVHRMADDCLAMYDQVRRRKYQVVMSGYYGFSNAGDDAILEAIHQSILQASGDVGVTVLSNNPQETQSRYGLNAIPRFQILQVFRALRGCDALLSGGGSLLQDRTSTRSLLYYLSIVRCAEWLGKPVMLYANGIGPVHKPGNRRRVKRAVERAALVTLRDHSSAQELKEMGVEREDLHVTADPVFQLAPAGRDRAQVLLGQAGLEPGTAFAAVSVRDWPGTGSFPQELAALCDHLYRTYGLEILFLLMQPCRDQGATAQVRRAMAAPSHLLDAPCSPKELMAVLGEGTLCVAMRLHTLIFSARMAVPVLGLVYDPKVDSYLKELGMPCAGDVQSFCRETAIAAADGLMADYSGYLARLRKKSAAMAQAARENETLLLDLLQRKR